MPAKFKESERVYRKDARGRRMSTDSQKCKVYKHYYLKQTPKKELFEAINSPRTKPMKFNCRRKTTKQTKQTEKT